MDAAGYVGEYTSLALDTTGQPHISYSGGGLRYAYSDGTAWFTETVDAAGYVGEYTSLALDSSGRPHISYYDWLYGDLKYAYVYAFPVEGIISPAGGPVSSTVDQTEYTFPAGAFSETVRVVHVPRAPSGVPAPGGTLAGIHHFYSATAVYSDTGQPAVLVPGATYTVTIGYTDQERGSVREETLALYRWNGSDWTSAGIPSTIDPGTDRVTAQVGSLGLFGVLGEPWRVYLPVVMRH